MNRKLTVILLLVSTSLTFGSEHPGQAEYDTLLKKHVKNGRVDYAGLNKEKDKLKKVIEAIASADISKYSRAEKLAFYINAYNACTLDLILRHWPDLKSIRDIEWKYNYHPWKSRLWTVAGKKMSLDEIEHKKLREELKEPRIHFAIVCASIGCPPLLNRAFTAKTLEKDLDRVTTAYVSSPHGMKTGSGNTVYLSRIFKWFSGDFQPSAVEYIAKYNPELKNRIKKGNIDVQWLDYDWKLNDIPGK